MYISVYKDVLFIEGTHKNAEHLSKVKVELMGIGAQLRNLRDVKEQLYLKIKAAGGNCLDDFEYGQKQRLLAFDDVAFYGSGVVAKLPLELYEKYFKSDKDDE